MHRLVNNRQHTFRNAQLCVAEWRHHVDWHVPNDFSHLFPSLNNVKEILVARSPQNLIHCLLSQKFLMKIHP